ncbi:hypothetical protein DICPUDRAFT_93806 [Dictyostelium purpureum]|uniref:Protein MON2 homolog n=1 Tax=Dictyostelium purpureum TaxID=5786 RepID=F0ZBV9_DICPU|nr:uncharacterized protein DICPUDRAFT_93806 [Dictyostelium purpureum]EGC38554.1 hypothetical protein DICPUDRAFT_93806 [Dictyostelium purpureum]|eukprot:XP_003284925.1 hypothetical protein DICPUDRAFT_93806 [Dictyostelium purpureum]
MEKLKSLLSVIVSDLRTISQEGRNKFQNIKDVSERVILTIKYLEEQSTTSEQLMQNLKIKSEEIIKPFLMALETKNQKMISIAIGSILKLISHSSISINSLPLILNKMQMLIDVGSDESVQLKVLQGLLVLITTMGDIHDDTLSQCLVLCFRLHCSKNISIQSTSSATLPQIIRIIFDRVSAEIKESTNIPTTSTTPPTSDENKDDATTTEAEQKESTTTTAEQIAPTSTASSPATPSIIPANINKSPVSTLKPAAKDAYLLLQDLCYITGGDSPEWLPPATTISRSSGLEFIEMIISVHHDIFFKLNEFKYLLKDKICPLLIKSFKFKMDFYHTVRLMRVITQFISKFSQIMVTESDVLLTRSIKMMDNENPIWTQILALESFRVYSEDPNLLRQFYINYDKDNNSAKIFENMTITIGKYIQNFYNLDSSLFTLVNTSKNRLIDLLWQNEPPQIKENYIISVCTECINGIVNAVSKINNPDIECDNEIFPQMANSCWVSILGAISLLLSKSNDEALIQMVLKSLQSFTNTCGELHLSGPRDALLTCLCKTTVLPSFELLNSNNLNLNQPGKEKEKDKEGNKESNSGNSEASSNSSTPQYSSQNSNNSNNNNGNGNGSSLMFEDKLSNFYPTTKNILSVKILFNIAHCMGSVLDESWILVLETLETWNRFFESFLKKKENSTSSTSATPNSNDITSSPKEISSPRNIGEVPILMNSMDNLFKSSSQLDIRSLQYLLEALGKLCTSSFNLKSFNSTPNMFGITKLKDTALANLYRIDKIWPMISDHIIDAGNHRNLQFRKYSVEFLNSIIKSTISLQQNKKDKEKEKEKDLSSLQSPTSDDLSQTNENEDLKTTAITTTITTESDNKLQLLDKNQIQLEFFITMEELSFSTSNDTKEKVLESIYIILSNSGQSLTTAWPIILSTLLRMSKGNEKRFITLSFSSLELICNEFLSNLTPECLALTIELIESFVSQKSEINNSLTASSGLLSDLTYFLANENSIKTSKYHVSDGKASDPVLEAHKHTSSKPSINQRIYPSISENSPFFKDKTRSLIDRMWLCVFSSMKTLSIDSRAPIRNGVVVIFFQILTTYFHLFEKDLLEIILWDTLFPLLSEIKSFSEKADQERIDSDLGSGVKLLVHHSRNTAQKQWDETQVLSIGGMVRIFKQFFDTLTTLPSFLRSWECLLNHLETESKSTSKEVSLSSLSFLHEIVNTSSIIDPSHPELSESIWETLLRLSKLFDQQPSSSKTLSVYIKVFTDLFNKTRSQLDHQQMNRALGIIFPMGISIGDSSTDLSNPQTHAIQIIKSLPPLSEDIFPSIIGVLLKYISIGINQPFTPSSNCDFIFPPLIQTKDLVYYSTITEKSIELIYELFSHQTTTDSMRSLVFEDIIKMFGFSMLTKYTKYHSTIWKLSISNLIKILPSGLLAINSDSNYLNDIKRNIIWTELIDSIQTFILHERPNHPISPEKKLEEDKYDIDLINAISKEMVGFSGIKVERVSIIRDRLVEILQEGSMLSAHGREKVAQSCYQNMFSICSKAEPSNPESIEIAKVVLPVVLKRCKEVLQRFVIDERQSGSYPLPRYRLSEISFILKEIYDLQLQPGVYHNNNQNSIIKPECKRPHLLELYPILCDCICTSEKEIKELLKNIFIIVSKEFLNIN